MALSIRILLITHVIGVQNTVWKMVITSLQTIHIKEMEKRTMPIETIGRQRIILPMIKMVLCSLLTAKQGWKAL